MEKLLRIGLAWQSDRRSREDAIRGIAAYATRYGPWEFSLNQLEDFDVRQGAGAAEFDGIIISHDDVERVEGLAWPKKIPTVALQATDARVTAWQVRPDNAGIGRLVGEEFVKRRFHNFAYCPQTGLPASATTIWDRDRLAGFSAIARTVGAKVLVYRGPAGSWGHLEYKTHSVPLTEWLASLPKPVGIMAATDLRARHLMLSAQAAAVRVPEEVAVIGVDNEAWAEVLFRGLSSVELDGFRAGYAGAELVHRLIEGKSAKRKVALIPPRRLIVRRSSSTIVLDDADVLAAIRYISEHASAGIGVAEVADAVPLSRRTLERRFYDMLGRTIFQEIRSVQTERAKQLLADESIPLRRVAEVAGFSSAKNMIGVFHRVLGMTPSECRAKLSRPAK